ncbi:hypothetical protein ACLKA6_010085 [Drosophila palustris]
MELWYGGKLLALTLTYDISKRCKDLLAWGSQGVAEEYDYFVQEHKWSDSFTAVIPDRAEWQQETPLRRNELSFYTDGSKTEEGTGAGVYASDPAVQLSFRLPDWCSVFQAEIYAVWQAIKLIYTLEGPARNISIYIDSQAVIKALSTNTVKRKLTRNTAAALSITPSDSSGCQDTWKCLRYGGPYQDFCRSCGDEEEMESVQHLLCDCPALQRRRNRFLGKPFFVDLGSLANVRLEDLAHFLDSTGWFHGRP